MRYNKENINRVTFWLKGGSSVYIVDLYKQDTRGLSVVNGWSEGNIVDALNNGDWIEVIQNHDGIWEEKVILQEIEMY